MLMMHYHLLVFPSRFLILMMHDLRDLQHIYLFRMATLLLPYINGP